jgi:glutamyl-tRNA reductase
MYIAYTSRQFHHAKEATSGEKIQKVLNGMAVKMRTQNQRGCYYLEAINEFIATGTN